jgi:hypothetical protein
MTDSFVPFQPNANPDGSANPAAGRDDAILYGATVKDPGGLPLGTQEHLSFSQFYNAAGAPFTATLHVTAPDRKRIRAGTARLNVPSGWSVDAAAKPVRATSHGRETSTTWTVTPAADAATNQNYRISAVLSSAGHTGYTDDVVRVAPSAEGRFQRWGNWAEFDQWQHDVAPATNRLGRSLAQTTVAVGEDITIPVNVHNWSDSPQSGTVTLGLPGSHLSTPAASKPYGPLAPGADTVVSFPVSNDYTNATLPISNPGAPADAQNTNLTIPITTTYGSSGSSSEDLTLGIVPKTSIPESATAPAVDGSEGSDYTGEALDIGRKWEPGGNTRDCSPVGVDCGSSSAPGTANSTYAKVTRHGDDLYFFVHVRDDFQSYAVTPAECVGHWQADSVELLIDPRGNASQRLKDTADTFKLGVFPYTNDPTGSNGNGVNGPCWERDADNHQGYSTGPLAGTVDDAPNAPGVQVASTAHWVGTNDTTTDHAYSGGGYDLEVKIPMADLPAAVDPDHMGLNITPYDNDDNTPGTGSTVLRHTDQSTRLAWSTFGSVQSDPYRWGHATLPGYTPPAGRPTEAPPANVSHPNLDGAESPQTIYQSAHNGVPISGRAPAPANDRITSIGHPALAASSAEMEIRASGAGTARVYLWTGGHGAIPVWTTSCDVATDPPPDYGLSACAASDGATPPWSPDMSGRIVKSLTVAVKRGVNRVSIPLTAAERQKMTAPGSSALVSFETPGDEVQAFDVALRAYERVRRH